RLVGERVAAVVVRARDVVELAAHDRGAAVGGLRDDRVGQRIAVDVRAARARLAGGVLVGRQRDTGAGRGVVDRVDGHVDAGRVAVDRAVVRLVGERVGAVVVRAR